MFTMTKSSFWRKTGATLAVAALSVGLLTGCGGNKSDGAAAGASPSASSSSAAPQQADGKKYAGAKITIGAEAGGPYAAWYKEIAPQFTEKTGIQVEWQVIPHDNMHERFLTEAASGTGSIDVFTADQPWISEFAKQGFLEPLDGRLSDEDKKDFVPSALDVVSYEGAIYALPFLVHTPIVYYRTDLFEKAGIAKPPETWDEFREYAKKLNDPANGVYGTIVEGKQSGEPVTHLIDRFLQFGGSLMDGDKITVDSPENANAFKFMLALQYEDKTSPEGAVGFDNADVHNLFMQGKAAMVINWPYMYSMANDPAQSKVAGKFAIAVQPKGVKQSTAAWSWGYAISSSSKNKEAAFEWLKWSTSSEVMKEFGKKFINPVARLSAVDTVNSDPSLKEEDKKAIATMSQAVEFGHNVTMNPAFPQIQERLAVTLSKIMTKQSTPEDEIGRAHV